LWFINEINMDLGVCCSVCHHAVRVKKIPHPAVIVGSDDRKHLGDLSPPGRAGNWFHISSPEKKNKKEPAPAAAVTTAGAPEWMRAFSR
jgi:hypothetical protein